MAQTYGSRWRVVGDLGQGGQASVFKVIDLQNKDSGFFALKRLADGGRIDRLKREVSALRDIAHQHIVPLVAHSLDDNNAKKHFLVMRLASGGDAEKRKEEFRGNIVKVLNLAWQVTLALEAAHARGVIHRDVKPANILFRDAEDSIWLADFGICKIDDTQAPTPDGRIMGPRRFSAPEIEQGNNTEVSPDVDFYSLGQVLFYLFSGGSTFHRENVFSKDYDYLFDSSGQSREFRLMLGRLVVQKDARFSDARQVLEAIEQLRTWDDRGAKSELGVGLQTRIALLRKNFLQGDDRRSKEQEEAERKRLLRLAVAESAQSTLQSIAASYASAFADADDLEARTAPDNGLRQITVYGVHFRVTAAYRLAVRRKQGKQATGVFAICLCQTGAMRDTWTVLVVLQTNEMFIATNDGLVPAAINSAGTVIQRSVRQIDLGDGNLEFTNISIDDWPNSEEAVQIYLGRAFDQFLDSYEGMAA